MKPLIAVFGFALVLVATVASATSDATNGAHIYNGAPSAAFPGGTRACASCHDVTNPGDIIRAGASPQAISFAIASFADMNALFSSSGRFPLSASDIADVAAFIGNVVNPAPPSMPTFAVSPPSGNFGAAMVGSQSAPLTFTVADAVAAGTVTSVASSNVEFLLAGGSCIQTPHDVALGGTCTVSVIFAPALAGARNGDLLVMNTGTPNPLRIGLAGTGANGTGESGPVAGQVAVVEFYNAVFDHYFVTPVTGEIQLLGHPPFQDWQPTGLSFNAYAPDDAPPGSVGICRFFNDHFAPKSTHFYAPHGLGCEATLAQFPDWTLEDAQLFAARLPDAQGVCPASTIPLYRLYNDGQGDAPNHRFTTRLDIRQAMLDRGYVAEGNGIGVGMCVPG
jgi:hypothetical protein